MAKVRRRRCRFCGQLFRRDPRLGSRHYACPEPACQTQRKRANRTAWSQAHPDYSRDQYAKKRPWFQARPGYHAALRKRSPQVAERHRARERERRQLERQEQDAVQVAVRIQDAVARDLAAESPVVAQSDSLLIHLAIAHQFAGELPRVAQPDPMERDVLLAYKRLHAIHRWACRIRRRRHA